MGVELSKSEYKNYSVMRAINWLSTGGAGRNCLESEISATIARDRNVDVRGILVPNEILRRDLVVGTDTAGGHLVTDEKGGLIDLLRDHLIIGKLGATFMSDLVGNISFPKLTSGTAGAIAWVGEGGNALEGNQTFDLVNLEPKTLAVYVDVTRRMMKQSSVAVSAMVTRDIAQSFAAELDRVAIEGSGSNNEPRGILNTTGHYCPVKKNSQRLKSLSDLNIR